MIKSFHDQKHWIKHNLVGFLTEELFRTFNMLICMINCQEGTMAKESLFLDHFAELMFCEIFG